MNRKYLLVFVLFAALLLSGLIVGAQTSPDYNLEWHVVAGGGGRSVSAGYVVNGSMGQSVTSPPYATNSTHALCSGFWFMGSGFSCTQGSNYMPIIVRP